MADTELIQINKGIKRLVKLIETSTIVDKAEVRKARDFATRERDEKGRFIKKEVEIQDKKEEIVDKEKETTDKQKELNDKELLLHSQKSGLAEKNAEMLSKTKADFKKKLSADWELWKNNSKLVQLHRAFWKSEAGQAIKNVFGRVKTIFSNILGEIGEFFGNLWGTVQDTFQFFKGTIGSIVNVLRGGTRRNKREKEQAKDIKNIRKSLTRKERKALLRREKPGKPRGLFSLLGLKLLFGVGSLVALLPLLLPALGIGALVAAFGMMLHRGIKSYMDSNKAGKVVGDAIKGFITLPRIIGKWILKLVDLIFGTDVAKYLEKDYFEGILDKHLQPTLDVLFNSIFAMIKEIIVFTKDVISGKIQERIGRAIDDYLYEILPTWLGGREKTAEEKKQEKDGATKKFMEKMGGTTRSFSGYDIAGQRARIQKEKEKEAREKESLELLKKGVKINEELKEKLAKPREPGLITAPSPMPATKLEAPDILNQRMGYIPLQNNN